MIYIEFTDEGYKCFNKNYSLLFTENNSHNFLFEYLAKDLSSLPKLLKKYISNRLDITNIKLKEFQDNTNELLEIQKTLESVHPFYKYSFNEIITQEIGNYFNHLLFHLQHLIAKDEYYKIIRILIPDRLEDIHSIYDDFYNEYAKGMALSVPEDMEVVTYASPKPQEFQDTIKTQKDISNMLHFILDIDAQGMETLSMSQRSQLYGKVFQRNSKPLAIKKRTSFIPFKHEVCSSATIDIYNSLYELSYTEYNEIPTGFEECLSSAIKYIDSTATTKIYEVYEIDDLYELLYLEVVSMVKADTMIRKCKNCNKYFVINNRRIAYCDRIYTDGMRCSSIGSKRLFQQKLKDDEALNIYTRSYKTHHARVRNGKMTQKDFSVWCDEAKQNLEKTRNGDLNITEFQQWLKK